VLSLVVFYLIDLLLLLLGLRLLASVLERLFSSL
jgi:hypothetical protein